MRIISKYKDYYDGVMQHGMDLDLRYIRDPREEVSPIGFPTFSHSTGPFQSRIHIIGFCGGIYPAVEIASRGSYIADGATPRPELMIHDMAHLEAYMKANLKDDEWKNFEDGKISAWRSPNNRATWVRFFDHYEKIRNSDFAAKAFEFGKAPIFVISADHKIRKPNSRWDWKHGIVYNPLLKQYNFAKVKDPYTAFQDLRMWLSNQAAPAKPMKEMTNEENAARLGHGDKYSFRRPPTKHA